MLDGRPQHIGARNWKKIQTSNKILKVSISLVIKEIQIHYILCLLSQVNLKKKELSVRDVGARARLRTGVYTVGNVCVTQQLYNFIPQSETTWIPK